MPHGTVVDPRVFVSIAPDGIVTIVAHRSEMGTGVRTSLPMIVAEEMEADWSRVRVAAGARRRGQVRQPGHRRLAQHAALSDADAPDRRLGALDAGSRRRQALGRAGRRGEGRQSRGRPRASGRRLGFGELAADAAKAMPVPGIEGLRLKDPKDFRYHRQGPDQHRRPARYHHRQGALRHRHAAAGHDIRRDRAPAGRPAASWCRSTTRRR